MQEKMRGRWGTGQQEGERKSSQLSHDRWSLVKKSTNLSNKVFFSLVTEIQTSFLLLSVCNACMLLVYMCWWLMISLIIDIGTCSFCSVLRRRLCLHSSNKHFKIGSAEFQKVWAVFHPDHFAMLKHSRVFTLFSTRNEYKSQVFLISKCVANLCLMHNFRCYSCNRNVNKVI